MRMRVIGNRSARRRTTSADDRRSASAAPLGNSGLNLTFAFDYGGQEEIAAAARELARAAAEGRLDPETITPELFASRLFTAGLPEPDLVIRTSGERRLSNFLLWQSAYAELLFVETLWPDFGRQDLLERARQIRRSANAASAPFIGSRGVSKAPDILATNPPPRVGHARDQVFTRLDHQAGLRRGACAHRHRRDLSAARPISPLSLAVSTVRGGPRVAPHRERGRGGAGAGADGGDHLADAGRSFVLWPHAIVPYIALLCGAFLVLASLTCRAQPSAMAGRRRSLSGHPLRSRILTLREIPPHGGWLVGALFAVVWATDTGALVFGNLVGGPKLAPVLSPNKTWSGTIGGIVVAAITVGDLYRRHRRPCWCGRVVRRGACRLRAFRRSVRVLGQAPFRHIKNSGGLIPGHGGVLDRIDSTLFAVVALEIAVFVFHLDPLFGASP